MAVNTEAIGKAYPEVVYAVGREKVREYARAVGEVNPLHLDPDAARAAGYADVVAPPMFCVVYSAPAMGPAIMDPEVGINLMLMLHGSQEFQWGEPVVAGDEITTQATVKDISERNGMGFYVFESKSTNQRGEQVCLGTWTNIVKRSLMSDAKLEPGANIPELRVTPDKYLTVRYAGASGDFNPIHVDDEFAKAVGLPGKILHGLWMMAQVARAQTDAAGGPDKLRRLAVQFRGMGTPEQELVVTGTVREVADGRALIDTVAEQSGNQVIRNAEAEVTV